MQHDPNYQVVLVSKTLYKRIVSRGAICSVCLDAVNIHGSGRVPCEGGHPILDPEELRPNPSPIPPDVGRLIAGPPIAIAAPFCNRPADYDDGRKEDGYDYPG